MQKLDQYVLLSDEQSFCCGIKVIQKSFYLGLGDNENEVYWGLGRNTVWFQGEESGIILES